jgi:L-alanine-DL-glutamate epimerase-like enolase superfamily enzyme
MKIVKADVIPLRVPFVDGGSGNGLMPSAWNALDMVLLRLETDNGIVGWGEAFGYFHRKTVTSAIREMIVPHIIGAIVEDIPEFTRKIQHKLHLFGRYGITMFAISALDIALWDIAAKQKNVSLAELVGGVKRERVPVYASLVRYGDPVLVEKFARKAVNEGYSAIKLHEITYETISAGRRGAPKALLSSDINCNWSMAEAEEILPQLKELDLYWVEEPVFPPDNEKILADIQSRFGISIASGENACTAVEFARTASSIEFLQPSIIKVGGVTEFIDCCRLIEKSESVAMPHCPYFGPGYWATLQLMAADPSTEMFEFLYIEPEAWLDANIPLPKNGQMTLPDGPGLGFNPDHELLERFSAE